MKNYINYRISFVFKAAVVGRRGCAGCHSSSTSSSTHSLGLLCLLQSGLIPLLDPLLLFVSRPEIVSQTSSYYDSSPYSHAYHEHFPARGAAACFSILRETDEESTTSSPQHQTGVEEENHQSDHQS